MKKSTALFALALLIGVSSPVFPARAQDLDREEKQENRGKDIESRVQEEAKTETEATVDLENREQERLEARASFNASVQSAFDLLRKNFTRSTSTPATSSPPVATEATTTPAVVKKKPPASEEKKSVATTTAAGIAAQPPRPLIESPILANLINFKESLIPSGAYGSNQFSPRESISLLALALLFATTGIGLMSKNALASFFDRAGSAVQGLGSSTRRPSFRS